MSASKAVPSAERLLELIAAMAGREVVMVADLVADRFITGTPKRISREAPVLILAFEEERLLPGGGANAVANVAALGGKPLPVGAVGDDVSGRGLLSALAERGVDTGGILVKPGYRTPTKTRILGGGRHSIKQQIVRYDVEQELELAAGEQERLLAWVGRRAASARVAVLSDYGYGAVIPSLVAPLGRALAPETLLLCDSRHRLAELAAAGEPGDGAPSGSAALTGATPNEEEAETLLGRPLGEEPEEVAAAGGELAARLGLELLLVTRGSRGMSLFTDAGSAHLPVHGTDQVADVTGAGDTVIGTFALALAAGATPLEAALLADYAGGVVVMKMGTATLSAGELAAAVEADPLPRQEIRWVGC